MESYVHSYKWGWNNTHTYKTANNPLRSTCVISIHVSVSCDAIILYTVLVFLACNVIMNKNYCFHKRQYTSINKKPELILIQLQCAHEILHQFQNSIHAEGLRRKKSKPRNKPVYTFIIQSVMGKTSLYVFFRKMSCNVSLNNNLWLHADIKVATFAEGKWKPVLAGCVFFAMLSHMW